MRKTIVFLLFLLAAQVALVVMTNRGPQSQGPAEASALLTLQADQVQEVLLTDGQGTELTLQREGNGFVLPQYFHFPVDGGQVAALVEQLRSFPRSWPEATTEEARTRFKVAAEGFERKLELTATDGGKTVIYFGTSPGLRKIYCRKDGEQEVYALPLALHDLSTAAKDWIETSALHLDEATVARIELPGLALVRDGEGFQLEHMAANEQAKPEAIDRLVKRACGLDIDEVLPRDYPRATVLAEPELVVRFLPQSGEAIEYRLARPLKEGEVGEGEDPHEPWFLLQATGRESLFRVEAWPVNEIKTADRASLVETEEPPEPAASGDQGEAAPAPQAEQPVLPQPEATATEADSGIN